MNFAEKTIIGLTEEVTIRGNNGKSRTVIARIDSGATKSSIDESLALDLTLGPVVGTKIVKQAQGKQRRPVVLVKLKLKGHLIEGDFTVADRHKMKYPVLIGQNLLREGFLIDPSVRGPG